jgi:hypothetical protein
LSGEEERRSTAVVRPGVVRGGGGRGWNSVRRWWKRLGQCEATVRSSGYRRVPGPEGRQRGVGGRAGMTEKKIDRAIWWHFQITIWTPKYGMSA